MSFTYDQKVGKNVYVYEIQSYWDKEKKAPRQQRVYLGKRDPATGKVTRQLAKHPPRWTMEMHIFWAVLPSKQAFKKS